MFVVYLVIAGVWGMGTCPMSAAVVGGYLGDISFFRSAVVVVGRMVSG
jgi:hypothetical protein